MTPPPPSKIKGGGGPYASTTIQQSFTPLSHCYHPWNTITLQLTDTDVPLQWEVVEYKYAKLKIITWMFAILHCRYNHTYHYLPLHVSLTTETL